MSPDPHAQRRLVVLAGLALLGAAAGSWALRADDAHGLTARFWNNPSFEGPPARVERVREPFVALGQPAPFSAEYRGYFFAPRAGRYRFEVWSDDDGLLDVDGQRVVSDAGPHGARPLAGVVQLARGLHPFDLHYVQRGGGAYLRVFYHYDSGPAGNGVIPLPWSQLFPDDFTPTPEAYLAAAGAYARERLLAGVAIACAILVLFLAWVHFRRRRGHGPVPGVELAWGWGIFAAGWAVRLVGLDAQGRTWDERDYFQAAINYVHNLVLGDWSTFAFRFNFEHPPIAKWIYALFTSLLATNDDDHLPGKLAASLLGAGVCLLTYLIVKELYDRRSGVLAGLSCALLPPFVAHGKVLGLEAPMTFFYVAAIYGVVRWFRDDTRLEAVGWAGLATSLAIFSRMTAIWVLPTLLVPYVCAVAAGPERGRRARALLPYLGGIALGVGAAYLLWPLLWHHPYDQFLQIYRRWGAWRTKEWVYGRFQEPPWTYYEAAFLLSAPAGYLLCTAAWAVSSLRRRRAADLILAGFLLFPFLQSISTLRQDAVRYVIQAFPALAATSAVGFFRLWSVAEARLPALRRPWAPAAAASALVLYATALCAWIHPYYLDYFNEILGGPAGIERGRTIELSWWGEGITNLVAWVNDHADPNARISEHLVPDFDVPMLRSDLVQVASPSEADYIVENDFSFAMEAGPGPGWEVVYRARAGNQDIGWVFRRTGPRAAAGVTAGP